MFGTPIAAFGMQAALVHHIPYAMAFSALAMGIVYVVLASVLYSRHRESLRLLVESFFALALIFGTLAIPLALDPRWTSAAWAFEGAACFGRACASVGSWRGCSACWYNSAAR